MNCPLHPNVRLYDTHVVKYRENFVGKVIVEPFVGNSTRAIKMIGRLLFCPLRECSYELDAPMKRKSARY